MQTLGVSESTPRTESRLKALFWPSVESGADVDYLGAQGYWVCAIVSVLTFFWMIVAGSPTIGAVIFLFYYLGGVGVRQRSRYAAVVVFVVYFVDTLTAGFSVVRILLTALLLSNVRATWIASSWNPTSEEAVEPPRFNKSFGDKFTDQVPQWLWPKVRVIYYIFSGCVLALGLYGAALIAAGMTERSLE